MIPIPKARPRLHHQNPTPRHRKTHITNFPHPVGTERHNINIYNVNGTFLNTLEPYSSFLHSVRGTPIAATAFHPHRMMLACAAVGGSHVNLFGCAGS